MKNSCIFVTGGTGSFGKNAINYLLKGPVGEIRVFSRDEKKQDDMRRSIDDDRVKYIIGDVRDFNSVNYGMIGVDFVYHAAALKQVPSCEFYPLEAYKTNVLGTDNVLKAAEKNSVKKVVALSTDKAVYPINAMGISKAMMEKLVVARSRVAKNTRFVATRYGNVMASRGSVIPLFIGQIKAGLPITITNPNMTRFMMTLAESVDLVHYAFDYGNTGEIFIQKAPSSSIEELAEVLKDIFNADNEIRVIGTRHGEKLFETLLTREEMINAEDMGRYYRIRPDNRDLNYEKYFSQGAVDVEKIDDYHSHNTKRLNKEELKEMLLSLDYVRSELDSWNA